MAQLASWLKAFIGLRNLEDMLKELESFLEELGRRRPSPAVLAWLSWAWTEAALVWCTLDELDRAGKAFTKARETIRQLDGEAEDLARVLAAYPLVDYLRMRNRPKEAIEVLSMVRKAILRLKETLKRPVLPSILEEALQPLGGDVRETLKLQLDRGDAIITFIAGDLRLNAGDIEGAAHAFKNAWAKFHKLKDAQNALAAWSFYIRAYVIKEGLSACPSYLEEDRIACTWHYWLKLLMAKRLWERELLAPEVYYTAYIEALIAWLTGLRQGGHPPLLDKAPLSGVPIDPRVWAVFAGTYCLLLRLLHGLEPDGETLQEALRATRAWAEGLERKLRQGLPRSSTQELSAILLAMLEGRLGEAISRAREASKGYSPLLNRLFSELAEAIEAYSANKSDEGARRRLAEALIKLFYYHV